MKIPSNLLTAMLLTAAIGTTATSCANLKVKINKASTEQSGENETPRDGGDPCTACGMG